MATFILTWQPQKWGWIDLADCCAVIERGQEFLCEWGNGPRKTMVPGDNVYFLRQKDEPLGVFGHGIVTRQPVLRDRWDDKTKEEYVIEVRVKSLLDPTVMAPLDLRDRPHPIDKLWNATGSGARVDPNGSHKLRALWQEHWAARHPHGLTIADPEAPPRKKLLKLA